MKPYPGFVSAGLLSGAKVKKSLLFSYRLLLAGVDDIDSFSKFAVLKKRLK